MNTSKAVGEWEAKAWDLALAYRNAEGFSAVLSASKGLLAHLRTHPATVKECLTDESPADSAGDVLRERTPTDYALEHAEYMAKDGDELLSALEALSAAELVLEESGEDDDGAVADARDAVWGRVRALRSGLYEFRKRRDRARSLAAPKEMTS